MPQETQKYFIQAPDGKVLTLEGPVGADHDTVLQQAQALYTPDPKLMAIREAQAAKYPTAAETNTPVAPPSQHPILEAAKQGGDALISLLTGMQKQDVSRGTQQFGEMAGGTAKGIYNEAKGSMPYMNVPLLGAAIAAKHQFVDPNLALAREANALPYGPEQAAKRAMSVIPGMGPALVHLAETFGSKGIPEGLGEAGFLGLAGAAPEVLSGLAQGPRAVVSAMTSPESLMLRASSLKTPVTPGWISHTADFITEKATGMRPTKAASTAVRSVRAAAYERVANWAAGEKLTTIGAPGQEAVITMARANRPITQPEVASTPPGTPQTPKPFVPPITQGGDLNRFLEYQRASTANQLTEEGYQRARAAQSEALQPSPTGAEPTGATQTQPQSIITSEFMRKLREEPSPPTSPFAAIEEAIQPSGYYAKKSSQLVDAKGVPTNYGRSLIAEVPEIVGKAKGPQFDTTLVDGFRRAEQRVSNVEESIPDTTLVAKDPIVQKLKNLAKEYDEVANPKTAAAIDRLLEQWKEKPAQIPWKEFLKSKRSFFKEANTRSVPMRKAYSILMDASGDVSKALAEANKSYSTVRRAMDYANIDIKTGRRIMEVGKPPKQ